MTTLLLSLSRVTLSLPGNNFYRGRLEFSTHAHAACVKRALLQVHCCADPACASQAELLQYLLEGNQSLKATLTKFHKSLTPQWIKWLRLVVTGTPAAAIASDSR